MLRELKLKRLLRKTKGTPFVLDVASAVDGDGDSLTFCWGQYDLQMPQGDLPFLALFLFFISLCYVLPSPRFPFPRQSISPHASYTNVFVRSFPQFPQTVPLALGQRPAVRPCKSPSASRARASGPSRPPQCARASSRSGQT